MPAATQLPPPVELRRAADVVARSLACLLGLQRGHGPVSNVLAAFALANLLAQANMERSIWSVDSCYFVCGWMMPGRLGDENWSVDGIGTS